MTHRLPIDSDLVARIHGALDDMRVAGLIMKVVVGFSISVTIAVIFFRWYNVEESGTAFRRRV